VKVSGEFASDYVKAAEKFMKTLNKLILEEHYLP
jgi:hypothetical protein